MPVMFYNGPKPYIDPAGRFVLETGDLVELPEPEAGKLESENNDFSRATKKQLKAAAAKAEVLDTAAEKEE